ncbi:hypothetical protein [Flavobacterium subsaxonicum]|nr:hypothetical protein [Flavobacterium subsaxonicum]
MDPNSVMESKVVGTACLLLIVVNLVSLYFIVDLYSYDEITGYLGNGALKSCGTRGFVYLMFPVTMSNLLFIGIALMVRFIK